MKLSALMTPDRVTLESAHGECYRVGAENEGTYTTRRDRAEQALVKRALTDPEFAALCSAMTDSEWSMYLDEHCGCLPGSEQDREAVLARRRGYRETAAARKDAEMAALGYITLHALAEKTRHGITRIRNWVSHGYVINGARVLMQVQREGRLVYTRMEWYEDFIKAAPVACTRSTESLRGTRRVVDV